LNKRQAGNIMVFDKKCFLCAIMLCTVLWAHAQPFTLNADLRFENYNASSNFVNQFVISLAPANNGYVWVGANGVNRFDGSQFVQYHKFDKPDNGLKNNYTGSMAGDKYGRVWIGTALGLCYYNEQTDKFNTVNIDGDQKISYAYALATNNDRLWFLSNPGLCYADLNTLKVYTTSLTKRLTSLTVFAADDTTLLVSGYEGAFIYHIKQNTAEVMTMPPGIAITSAARTGNTIWLGSNAGIWKLSGIKDPPRRLKGTEKYNISIDCLVAIPALTGDSVLWAGTDDGLVTYNVKNEKPAYRYSHDVNDPNSLQSNEVTCLRVDKNNLLWIGTDNGLTLFNYKNQVFKTRLLRDIYVLRVVQDKYNKKVIWIATYKKGLIKAHWDTKQVMHTYYPVAKGVNSKEKAPVIYDIAQVDKGKWLLNKGNKLLIWDEKQGVETELDNVLALSPGQGRIFIRNLIPAGKDSFYVTSSCGLFFCNTKTKKNYRVIQRNDTLLNSPDNMISGVYNKGILWIATSNGFLKYEVATGKQKRYYPDVKSPDANRNYLAGVVADNKGNIIITGLDGICVMNIQTEQMRFYNDFNTIKDPACYSIFMADSLACINTDAGLVLFNTNTGKSVLYAPEYTELSTALPFGTIDKYLVNAFRNGYSYFTPAAVFYHEIPSSPVIEKITINDKSIYFPSNNTGIELKYDQNILGFYFTAFEYTNPGQIHFRYRLQGLDNNWHYTSTQRVANYIKIPPGNYTFTIQAGNSKHEWNGVATTFRFKINPPFWATWWFRISMVLGFTGGVTGMALYRVRKIKKEEERKTAYNRELIELEMKALRSQMNPHFIFNSLNSIQKFIWENKQEDAAEYLSKFSRLIRMILDNSMQKWITLEQELATLMLYMELEHRRSNNKFDYSMISDDRLNMKGILVPPMILQPYVENAIWHGLLPKDGRGRLNITIMPGSNDDICCVIEDNGIGRKAAGEANLRKEKNYISYGMQITGQRIMMAASNGQHGSVIVEDLKTSEGAVAGTKVIINIPVNSFVKI